VELDEEQAARDKAIATTAPPAVTTCCLRRSDISGFSLEVLLAFQAAVSSQDQRQVSL
jgi:hypothetical protein